MIKIQFGPKRHPQPHRSPEFFDQHDEIHRLCDISNSHLLNLARYVRGYGKTACPLSMRDWGRDRVLREMKRRGFTIRDRLSNHPLASTHPRYVEDHMYDTPGWDAADDW